MARLYGKREACARLCQTGRAGRPVTYHDHRRRMIIDDARHGAVPRTSARAGATKISRGRIFVLALLALFTAGAAVSLRAATAVHMRMDYLGDNARAGEMIGTVLGAAIAGFAITLFLVSAALARVGFGRALTAAAVLLLAGFIIVGHADALGVSPY